MRWSTFMTAHYSCYEWWVYGEHKLFGNSDRWCHWTKPKWTRRKNKSYQKYRNDLGVSIEIEWVHCSVVCPMGLVRMMFLGRESNMNWTPSGLNSLLWFNWNAAQWTLVIYRSQRQGPKNSTSVTTPHVQLYLYVVVSRKLICRMTCNLHALHATRDTT